MTDYPARAREACRVGALPARDEEPAAYLRTRA